MNLVLYIVLLIVNISVCFQIKLNVYCYYPEESLSVDDTFFIRGDGLGINTTTGVEMEKIPNQDDSWLMTLEDDYISSFEFQIFKNDEVPQRGHAERVSFPSINEDTEWDVHVFPYFNTQNGTVELLEGFYSPQLGNTRNISIYLPPSYYENTLKPMRNILIMQDGQSLFDPATAPSWSPPWWCQNVSDVLISEGSIDEYMIVAPWTVLSNREYEYTFSVFNGTRGGGADVYLDYLEETMLPEVIAHYGSDRIQVNDDKKGILGSSYGGLLSCYAGWTRYDTYKKIGCMSSSFWWNNADFIPDIILKKTLHLDENNIFYVDTGTVMDCYNSTMAVKGYMDNMTNVFTPNVNYFFYLDEGASHTGYYWGRRFHLPLIDFYSPEDLELLSRSFGVIQKANLLLLVCLGILLSF